MPNIMLQGFTGLPESEPFITAAENRKNAKMVIENWMLGPKEPSNEPTANSPYWKALAKAMQVNEKEARRRTCGNCEYYNNTTMKRAQMESIPWNEYDVGAGFRGYCVKFKFVCHDLRSCQAWDEREFEED